MVIPGLGVDPAKIAAMQEISKYISGVIRVDYAEKSVSLTLSATHPEAVAILPDLVGQLSVALATQLSSYFAIKGEIVEVNKPSA